MEFPANVLRTQHFKLILQILLLLLAVFVFCYSVISTEWIGTPTISFLIIVVVTINIIRMVEKSNRDFAQFLSNITYGDFTSTSGASNQAFAAQTFVNAQKTLLSKYQKLTADRSAQSQYLQKVVEHVDSALICFDSEGKIEFSNKATTQLLNKKYIPSINVLANINPEMASELRHIRPGENRLLKTVLEGELNQLILSATEFTLLDRNFKLVSMKNIKGALDEREVESWQKLIKVLTHEIMNSMTPIVSLSQYIESLVSDKISLEQLQDEESEQFRDLHQSINAITSRSKGLMEFVDSYRSLSNLPKPTFAKVSIAELFNRIERLVADEVGECDIRFQQTATPPGLWVNADEHLLEQVLLNLLSNAFDAVAEKQDKKVMLEATCQSDGKVAIKVTDNGCGIDSDVIDNIFTPFYTTKDSGSGIGLSLSRQLARLNRGILSVSSVMGDGSQFTLKIMR